MTLKTKKHTQEAAVKGISRCSAVLNLREKSLKILDFSGKTGEGVGVGGWFQSHTSPNHQGWNMVVLERLQFKNV